MEPESGFMIDDKVYELPRLDTLTMDEAQVLYDYSGLTLEDFVERPDASAVERRDQERRLANPGFTRSLMHIAYQRGNPKIDAETIRTLIGAAVMVDALSSLADVDPPEANETKDSPESSDASSSTSGTDSTSGSDKPASTLARIGTGRSATSFQGSRDRTLEV